MARTCREAAAHGRSVDLFRALVADYERALGPDHPDTLDARLGLARSVVAAGDHPAAAELYTALLADQERALGPDHPDTLTTRWWQAAAHRDADDQRRAAEAFGAVAADRARVLGADHPDTLNARWWQASSYRAGYDLRRALDLAVPLVADTGRVLGPDHPDALGARFLLAWTYRSGGDHRPATELDEALLRDRIRLQGPDHPDTLACRGSLAQDRRLAGLLHQAEAEREALAADRARIHGPDHPDTLHQLSQLAEAVLATGELDRAAALFTELIAHRTRVQGPDHPDTLGERSGLASVHARAGRQRQEIVERLMLLADHERVHGQGHPDTLDARADLAHAHRRRWEHDRADALYRALLADRTRFLGAERPGALDVPGSPDALDAIDDRDSIALNLVEAGRYAEGAACYREALAAAESALGPEHLLAHAVRYGLAQALVLAGDHEGAIAELSPLTADWTRPAGPALPGLVRSGCVLAVARHLNGEHDAAVRLAATLAACADDALGSTDDATLTAREAHALLLACGPRPLRAVVRLEELAEECAASHGPRNTLTLSIRQSLAHARLRAGDALGAVRVYEGIVADRLPAGALLTGHRHADDVALSLGTLRPGLLPVFPTLAVGLAAALAASGRRDASQGLLAAVHTARRTLMGPGHPLAVESRTALARLKDGAARSPAPLDGGGPESLPSAPVRAELGPEPSEPAALVRRSRGSRHRPPAPAPARTAWRPRLTLLDEPAVRATVHLELRLEPEVPQTDPGELPGLRLVAVAASDAVLEPPVADYSPAGEPVRFALTPSVPGPHTVRITVYDRGHGAVLQDLSAVVDVPPGPAARIADTADTTDIAQDEE
ncbi:tetratricopeptide repeat protein [Kitasatospora sp. NBC_01300]|nr:tetratricopeptide repeat protein [Kitasatospora sp. NBC_01300]